MSNLRFAIIGTGFWARFQLAAWRELPGVECVAFYNRTRGKADALAREMNVPAVIPAVYDDAEEMFGRERLDFVDIITNVETHSQFVRLAAVHRLPVICQKPMATTLAEAEQMVSACHTAGVPFFIHENWRWQGPIRQVKRLLDEGHIGAPFRARIEFCNSFPVFDNQPFLKDLDEFILSDIGSHILDTARFLFGEASSLYCQTRRIHSGIRGEDVATAMMKMGAGTTVVCDMSYASRTERERFPQTFVLVEGERGSLELTTDYVIRVTTQDGTISRRYPPPCYAWADPAYDVVHSSSVPCNADLLHALRGEGSAETTAEDNLKTVRLVFASYQSAQSEAVMRF